MELTQEYTDLIETVRDFAQTVVAPVAAKHDEEHSFPYEVVDQMGKMGLFGLPFPEEYGGMGGDYFALALALEELGKVEPVGRHHPRGRCESRRDADRSSARGSRSSTCPTSPPARRWQGSASPNRVRGRTRGPPRPPPPATTATSG